LVQIVECFKEMPELARVAVNPFLSVRNKANIMDSILKDSGATEITKRLFSEWPGLAALSHPSGCSCWWHLWYKAEPQIS
jgi:hypothetical protein